jgi:hypothetical protein
MRYSLFLILILLGCSSNISQSLPKTEITDMYSSYIDDWKQEATSSFIDAESKIYVVNPIPKPDINDGTNPDPAKCICKGTGIIVQGDGHKTSCPYHSKSSK